MAKHFMYFLATEGGMETIEFGNISGLDEIPYWMAPACKETDIELMEWMLKAEVGEFKHHRLGTLVRLKDK